MVNTKEIRGELMVDIMGDFDEDLAIKEEYKRLEDKELGYSSQIENALKSRPRPKAQASGRPRPQQRGRPRPGRSLTRDLDRGR